MIGDVNEFDTHEFDTHVGAKLLDFFDSVSPCTRSLG